MQLPQPQVIHALLRRYARLQARYCSDLGDRPLVVPSAKFFPDTFAADAQSAQRLLLRMREHAGMADVPMRTALVTVGDESTDCCSGAACAPSSSTSPSSSTGPASAGVARVVDEGDGWLFQIPAAELRHPVALTTNLARSLAYVFLVETKLDDEILEPPVDVTADFTAVALGFGPLMLQGSYVYAKSCSGPRVTRVTKMHLPELALLVAVFAHAGQHDLAPVLRELDPTQKELLGQADRWVRANRRLVTLVAEDPKQIARGDFELEEPSTLLASVLRGLSSITIGSSQRKAPVAPVDPGLELDELEALLIAMPPSSTVRGRSERPPAQAGVLPPAADPIPHA